MCGIAGVFDLRADLHGAEAIVGEMTDAILHRGPDDAGMLVDPPIALGHRRLSILDLSPAGHQPMTTEDGSLWITYNGEIYNYVEIALELETLGYRLRTACDTEVLLLAYEAWGAAALDRLNGMFAFAVWDRRRRELFCARDRFGVKPFYYTVAGGRFRFASEIKALLVDPEVPRAPNHPRVVEFLAYALTDHTPETMFAGILQLPPGSYMRVDAARGPGAPVTWYRPVPAELNGTPAPEALGERLRDAVTLRLRSDVPLGIALSGGMDSGSVLALAADVLGKEGVDSPTSFSARCVDPRADEGAYVQSVARMSRSKNIDVLPGAGDLLADLDSLVWHMDEPFHGPSIYGQRRVHELARRNGVVVLLDGQGGDEALSGYHHFHYRALLADLFRRGRVRKGIEEIRWRSRLHGVSPVASVKELVKLLLPGRLRARRVPSWLARDLDVQLPPLPGPTLAAHRRYGLEVAPLPAWNHHDDRNSMCVSLEARNPFLDYRVVECGLALSAEESLHRGYTKWSLREAMRDLLPSQVVDRTDKQGFSTDESIWFRGELAAVLEAAFRSPEMAARGYFDTSELLRTLRSHQDGDERALELWRAFAVERWFRLFIDPPLLEPPAPRPHAPRSQHRAADAVVRLEALEPVGQPS